MMNPPKKAFYISNKALYESYIAWYAAIDAATAAGEEEPPIPAEIVDAIMKISTKLSYRPNFSGYSYKEEMIGDAIENTLKVVKKFNPEKSNNPFSYLTTIAWNAYIRRINLEKKETYTKGKLISELPLEDMISFSENDEDVMQNHSGFIDFLRENSYIVGTELPTKKKKAKEVVVGEIDEFLKS